MWNIICRDDKYKMALTEEEKKILELIKKLVKDDDRKSLNCANCYENFISTLNRRNKIIEEQLRIIENLEKTICSMKNLRGAK